MKQWGGIMLAGVLLPFPLMAVDIDNGQALHDANCRRCHDESRYMREDRLVNNLKDLREQVRQCELTAELAWFEEEIDDVTAYLNRYFYQFDGDTDK